MSNLCIILTMIFVFAGILLFSAIMYLQWIRPLQYNIDQADINIAAYKSAYEILGKKLRIATDYIRTHADSGELDAQATIDAIDKVRVA